VLTHCASPAQAARQLVFVASHRNSAQEADTDVQLPALHSLSTLVLPVQLVAPQLVLSATTLQVPTLPGSVQLWQSPVQPLLQHTPSTQWPLWHAASLVPQLAPLTWGLEQALFTHSNPETQSLLVVQVVPHAALDAQPNPPQEAVAAAQPPLPSQAWVVSWPPVQESGSHEVALSG